MNYHDYCYWWYWNHTPHLDLSGEKIALIFYGPCRRKTTPPPDGEEVIVQKKAA